MGSGLALFDQGLEVGKAGFEIGADHLVHVEEHAHHLGQESVCTIKEEIEILETYLAIEKVRFGERIKFKIEVDEKLYEERIPRFLLQPLVENAFKHGLKNVADDGLLEVSISKNNGRLEIAVSDNGSDFPGDLDMGYGLQSTYEKLDLIYPGNYQVQIFNRPKKQIRISLPASN